MDNPRRLSLRDCVVWAFVIGGHVLLLVLLARVAGHPAAQTSARNLEDHSLLLRFLSLPRKEREEEEEDDGEPPQAARVPSPATTRPPAETPRPDTAITLPPAWPSLDWQREAQDVARARAAEAARPGPRAFGEHPKSPYRKCKRPQSSFEWNPEPDKAGFAGGLPFVRLGERCMVGLGFFGCAIGDLPKPNSHLFDDMNDPNRVVGSVPDVDECTP